MILSRIENIVVDDMTCRQVRYVNPVKATQANGNLASIYRQIRSDFQLVPPLTMFSAAPELLAGVWSIWRESQFAEGEVPRYMSETVAAGVSSINACPYCVDAHTGMLYASSNRDIVKAIYSRDISVIENNQSRRILEWALANRIQDSDILLSPPFSKREAPEIIGTAVVYHFINRMVSIFLEDSPLPVPANSTYIRHLAVKIFGATVGKSILKRKVKAGESLKYIPAADLPADLNWALPNSHIAKAFSGFANIVENAGKRVISEKILSLAQQYINSWNGEDMEMNRNWLEKCVFGLNEEEKTIARLILMTALAPYQVCEKDIQSFRAIYPKDEALLVTTSWASFAAARRVGSWLDTY